MNEKLKEILNIASDPEHNPKYLSEKVVEFNTMFEIYGRSPDPLPSESNEQLLDHADDKEECDKKIASLQQEDYFGDWEIFAVEVPATTYGS